MTATVLTAAQRAAFDEQGYVVVEDVFSPEDDLAPLLAEYGDVLGRLALALQADGRLADLHHDLPFEQRLIAICTETGTSYAEWFDISLATRDVRADAPIHCTPTVFRLLTHPRLLDLVEAIVGPEIYSSPVQHVRLKLPHRISSQLPYNGISASVPLHQDAGVVMPDADGTPILTVWSPLSDATLANGCLQVVPGSHRAPLLTHCVSTGLGIPDELVPGAPVPLPMRAGGVLLMHRRTVHGSLDNRSEGIRWSFDLRYQPPGLPTGRDFFPGFLARSAAHPQRVLRDAHAWRALWIDARQRLSASSTPRFFRWGTHDPYCA